MGRLLFAENGALGASNPLETERPAPDLQRYRAGAAPGGPVTKNRTFYDAAGEQKHSRWLEDSFINSAAAASLNKLTGIGACLTNWNSRGATPCRRHSTTLRILMSSRGTAFRCKAGVGGIPPGPAAPVCVPCALGVADRG